MPEKRLQRTRQSYEAKPKTVEELSAQLFLERSKVFTLQYDLNTLEDKLATHKTEPQSQHPKEEL